MSKQKDRERPDNDLYRLMAVPFESTDALQTAMDNFFEELGELRKKYKITNLYVVVDATARHADGSEGTYINSMMYGNSLQAEHMTAWAFGHESAKRQAAIASVISAGGKSGGE